jgi:hypothetical protein
MLIEVTFGAKKSHRALYWSPNKKWISLRLIFRCAEGSPSGVGALPFSFLFSGRVGIFANVNSCGFYMQDVIEKKQKIDGITTFHYAVYLNTI